MDPGDVVEPEYQGPEVRDLREWVELVRRLHTPFYEEARRYWADAEADGFFSGANEVSPYRPDNLRDLIQEYRS